MDKHNDNAFVTQPVSEDIGTEIRDQFEVKPKNSAEADEEEEVVMVPSLTQMTDVMKTLTNGYCTGASMIFNLLHHLEKGG